MRFRYRTPIRSFMTGATTTRGRSLLTGGLLLAFVGLSYSSVIRRTAHDEFIDEFNREIAEEAARQDREESNTPGITTRDEKTK